MSGFNSMQEEYKNVSNISLAIEKAITAFEKGNDDDGVRMLHTHADDLLLLAIQTEDAELRKASIMLYDIIQFVDDSLAKREA